MKIIRKTNIRLDKIIVILLIIYLFFFAVDAREVWAYPYENGYDYYQYTGILDSAGKTHYFSTVFVNYEGDYLEYIIFNSDGTIYQETRIVHITGYYDYNTAGIKAVVPTSEDFSTIDIYIGLNHRTSGFQAGGLGVISVSWNGNKYSNPTTMRILVAPKLRSRELSNDRTATVDSPLSITQNGVVYRLWDDGKLNFEILGKINENGYTGSNYKNDKWYYQTHFSTNLQYAYSFNWEQGEYNRLNRAGVWESFEGDYLPILYNILDINYYNDTGKALYYNSIHNVGGITSKFYYNWYQISYIPKNTPPENLFITSPPPNTIYTKEEGSNVVNVEGSVRDPDDDDITVTAELAGVTKSMTLTNTSASTGAAFSFTFDVAEDNISEGNQVIKVSATDNIIKEPITASRDIVVQARVKHNGFVLIDSPLYYKLIYEDEERDPPYEEEIKFTHSPTYFKNSLGLMAESNTWIKTSSSFWSGGKDSNIWKPHTDIDDVKTKLLYNSLSLPGHYKIVSKARDNPKDNSSFDEFKMWSRESLSEINLYVHRKPVAVFTPTIDVFGNITIVDKSYDLDHQGEPGSGIVDRQWRWRKTDDIVWTNGKTPPTSFPPGEEYILGLRVRDKDGESGVGVWGDWTDITIGTGALAPLNALFTLNPSSVSHGVGGIITVENLSSPQSLVTKYEWIIKKAGVQQGSIISTSVPTSAQLKAYGIGKYTLSLKVGDNGGRWSEPYTLAYEVINNPPIAEFEAPDVVYRDDILNKTSSTKLINTTPADLDGDTITYKWEIKAPDGKIHTIDNTKDPSFKVQDIITAKAVGPVTAISPNWEIKLIATDSLGAKSEYTRDLEVINNPPIGQIAGPTDVGQYTSHSYSSSDTDPDTGDNPLSIFRWKHVKPDGSYESFDTKDIEVTFTEHGTHTIEHYALDQIGDKSNVSTLTIDVIENQAPTMTITNPVGTKAIPEVISFNPLMKWNYDDIENDAQERYGFDFYYADDDVLAKSIFANDVLGNIREHQMPEGSFERFRVIKAVGRVSSKNKWSELSNEVYFIINDAPTGGFDFNKIPANYVRNEDIIITGFGDDANIASGDSISFKYYLKKLPSGDETLLSSDKNFTFTIGNLETNKTSETYQVRQVITDSLGTSSADVIKTFTIQNQKPTVEIVEPSSPESNNPSLMSEVDLKPTIKWDYTDLDGDRQKRYRVTIYNGTSNNIVASSGEIASENKHWTVANPLVEDVLYSVVVEVYDGHEWGVSARKYFKVFSLKIEGYLLFNPAMAGDKIYFYITTEGYADKIEIEVDNDIISMDKRVEMGYPGLSYPLVFNVNKDVMKKEDILDYIVWVTTPDTINRDNVQVRQPYKFIVRAYKGAVTREIELELDIRGSVLELLKPGIKSKYGN